MQNLNFSNRISQNYSLLSKKERNIAEFISKHLPEITHWNIKDLAKLTDSSISTISRFCHKVGYTSFAEFKTFVAQELNTEQNEKLEVPETIASYYNQLIQSSTELMDIHQLRALVNTIDQANKILICGLGSSGLSAEELKSRLIRMGLNADVALDPHKMLMSASLLDENDLFIGISNSGTSQSVIEAGKAANHVGAPVFTITNRNHTPLTEISDGVLFTSENQYITDERFINSQISIIFILDILCYSLLKNPVYLDNRNKTLQALKLK